MSAIKKTENKEKYIIIQKVNFYFLNTKKRKINIKSNEAV